MTVSAPAAAEEREVKTSRSSGAAALIFKIIVMGLIDVVGIWAIVQAYSADWWLAVGFLTFAVVALNYAYFSRNLPLKYLLPGLLLLIVFQIYTALFTGYMGFTNYGSGHLLSKDQAIQQLTSQTTAVADSPDYPVVPLEQGGTVSMLVTMPTDGAVKLGTAEGLTDVPPGDVTMTGAKATGLAGYTTLNLGTMAGDFQTQWSALQVPLNLDTGTYLKASSLSVAREVQSDLVYDEAADTMTRTTDGTVFTPNDDGSFASESGEILLPGWVVTIGTDNFTALFTDPTIRKNFIPIMVWTFFFAFFSVLTTFVVGLTLAIIMNDKRMKGQKYYRLILILPYSLPIFLTAGLWAGMFNTDFGLINQILPGDPIPWLTEGTWAKAAVLIVNLWLGYPYMFLVCTGALTAIPGDLKEAAFVDGASGWTAFRTVVLPLLLIAVAPLLISSFAFNFNNFTLIQLLTGGGPFQSAQLEGGQTDLLINYTYRKAFNGVDQQLGLASAISMIIFLIVGTVSALGFRQTKKLEEIGV
jgi:arabinogalactan oligomer / maltooligosaccharide transport system permease protein